ncbi:hypothetical protein L3Y19_gp064 [Gordonia phage Neville]|uniref:Uncharacterized protein n=1 Tax=Gordonia phage Neville TaxID=2301693 RepID=A0A385DY41_9CAUD|nr:hypothetical protein L3Y19_gp064 [Gordonia phage Neville]AXQ64433.1 hypothetical protein SEA_NEVILLE_64 [Gordonia phage Neville]
MNSGWEKIEEMKYSDGDVLEVSAVGDEIRFSVANSVGVYVPFDDLKPLIEMLESYAE